ncbi:N-acetylmuramoyl-L-alanine amidase [Lentibacillus sp. N15]
MIVIVHTYPIDKQKANTDDAVPETITTAAGHSQNRTGLATGVNMIKKGDRLKITHDDIIEYLHPPPVNKRIKIKPHLRHKTIVIDPGHGGSDAGAIGASGVLEKDLTFQTALRLRQVLIIMGADVILTRKHDDYVALASRTSLSNSADADAFLSIHYNNFPEMPDVAGISTYYYGDENKGLADPIQTNMIKKTKADDRGTVSEDFQVLRQNKKAAVLVELGFLSNQTEEQLLVTDVYQKQLVNGITEGLIVYFKKNITD